MIAISNCPNTGLPREVEALYLKDSIKESTIELWFVIYTKKDGNVIPNLTKTTPFRTGNNQLVDPIDGSAHAAQDEWQTYIGEYTHLMNEMATKSHTTIVEEKITRMDTDWLL